MNKFLLFQDSAKVEKAFKEQHLFSKEDLLQSFSLYVEYVQVNEENYTQKSVAEKLKLCKMFLEKLSKCKLPNITEDWWFYEYEASKDSISLGLYKADKDDIELDDDGFISVMGSTNEKNLFEVECRYVSVNEFAEIQNVKPATVLQWIHRGRLRYIKQFEDDWVISACEDKPTRNYEGVTYLIKNPLALNIDEYPTICGCDSLSIFQNHDDKSKYECYFDNYKMKFRQHFTLSKKGVEELEFSLLSSGNVKPDGCMQYVPLIERE